MVSDIKDNVVTLIKQTDEDPKNIIDALYDDKLKLLKEKKLLLIELAQKDEQYRKLSEKYQKKWESVCNYLKSIEELCNELNINDSRLNSFKDENGIVFDSQMDSSYSNSSYFTVTETEDSTFTTSSESLVATNDTIKKSLKPKDAFLSLNSLSNFNDLDKSDYESSDNIYPSYHTTNRPQSHCLLNNNKATNNHACIDSANSEPFFSFPDVPSSKQKHSVPRKSSIIVADKAQTLQQASYADKGFAEFTDRDLVNWLTGVARLPKLLIDDLTLKKKLDNICKDQITEQKLSKMFGISDKLIRKKIMLALEETRSNSTANRENIPDCDVSRKDHVWVANVWLKRHLGLGHLSQPFLSRCIDGRLLKYLATHPRQKDLLNLATTNYDHLSGLSLLPLNFMNKGISEPSKSDIRSIKYGLELLAKFNFDLVELEKRRIGCEKANLDVLVWTNERVAKWFHQMKLKNYIRGIEYSGIHGGIMVLDPHFSMTTMSKLLQIPVEVVKKNNLDDKFSALLKPSRFNEGVKNRRSTSLFRRRSLSQPRQSKNAPCHSPNNLSDAALTNSHNRTPPNHDESDCGSVSDSMNTSTLKPVQTNAIYKEKSQTIDLSRLQNQSHNFIRKYRKPNDPRPHPGQQMWSPTPDNHLLSPPPLAQSATISRKLPPQKSVSESDGNSEDL